MREQRLLACSSPVGQLIPCTCVLVPLVRELIKEWVVVPLVMPIAEHI